MSRLEAFEQMIEDNPNDPLIWYGLASEYLKVEKLDQAAEALRNVIKLNPQYTAAYQMLGSTLVTIGRNEEAVLVWKEGVEVAEKAGAWKAKQHIEGLLSTLSKPNDFCL